MAADEVAPLVNKILCVGTAREEALTRTFTIAEEVGRLMPDINTIKTMHHFVDEDKVILQVVQAARMVVQILETVMHRNLQVAVRRTKIGERSLILKLWASRCPNLDGRGECYHHPSRLKKKRSLLLFWNPRKSKLRMKRRMLVL
jgi:hypothetical protein